MNAIKRSQIIAVGMLTMIALGSLAAKETPATNALTPHECEAGWKLLFNGQSTEGWRGYKSQTVPPSWKIVNGSLVSMPKSGEVTGHLITADQYDNFELSLEWKMAPSGNSGVIYRATETGENPWDTGPEYQVLDNTKHLDGHNPLASSAACYAVYPPAKDVTTPLGDWNQTRIVANGNHVQHWLNEEKVVEYQVGSADWVAHVKTSRYWATADWGKAPKGHICLQDYGTAVEYRNIKIRVLAAAGQ